MIVVRLFGREVLAVGSPDPDDPDAEMCDSTAGGFELADPEVADRDRDVYLASKRQRPAIVAIGSRHQRHAAIASRAFGFRPTTFASPESRHV